MPQAQLLFLLYFIQVLKPLNQVLSSLVDQEVGHQIEHDNLAFDGTYTVEEFEVRILEPEKSGGSWQTRGTIPMQSSENALTVRVVTLYVSFTINFSHFLYFITLAFFLLCIYGGQESDMVLHQSVVVALSFYCSITEYNY